ncbi:MAG: glycosyltransferase [Bacteroidota bacterium]|nr:glycosyltransferase [Bacteroidota bacterium]
MKSNKKMKNNALVIIGDLGYPSGNALSNRAHLYSKSLKETDISPFIINTHSPHKTKQNFRFFDKYEGIPFYYSQKTVQYERKFLTRNLKKIKGIFHTLYIIKRLRKNNSITVLYYSIPFFYEFVYFLFLKFYRIPIAKECNEAPLFIIKEKRNKKLYTFILKHIELRMYDRIIVISDFLNQYYSRFLHQNKILQIPILVDMDRFRITSKNCQLHNEKIITYIGSMVANKDGLNNLIEAIYYVKKHITNFKMQLVGTANENQLQKLKDKVSSLNLTDTIIFLGLKKSSEIPEILSDSDLLVLARPDTNQSKAGFPTKLGEYLASKKPVVITVTGEISKYLKDKENAYLVAPDQIENFANKIIYALNDEDASLIGAKGYEVANNNFNYHLFGKKLGDFLFQSNHII